MGEGSKMFLEIEDRPWGSGNGKVWFCHGERRWQGANWPYEIWGSVDRAGRAGGGGVGEVIEWYEDWFLSLWMSSQGDFCCPGADASGATACPAGF